MTNARTRTTGAWGTSAGLAAALATTLLCATANAQEAGGGPARAATASKNTFGNGLELAKAGDYDGALAAFKQAYTAKPGPRVLFNIALCEEKLGRYLDALTHYRAVLGDAGTQADEHASARKHLDLVMGQVAHINVKAPGGTPIALDGGPALGTAPLDAPLDALPGDHVVTATLAGGPRSVTVHGNAGDIVLADLSPLPPEAPPPAVAPPPSASAPLPNDVAPPPPTQAPSPRTARTITVAVLGAAAVGSVVGGVLFGVQSQNDANQIASYQHQYGSSYCSQVQNDPCAKWNSTKDDQNRSFYWSTGLYVAGGVLAAGAVATWFLWPHPSEPRSALRGIVPLFDGHTAGAAVTGAF
jgi:tetratricopeptide (TPR) repeat protein